MARLLHPGSLHVKTRHPHESDLSGSQVLANGADSRPVDFDRPGAITRRPLAVAKNRRCAMHQPYTTLFNPSVPIFPMAGTLSPSADAEENEPLAACEDE